MCFFTGCCSLLVVCRLLSDVCCFYCFSVFVFSCLDVCCVSCVVCCLIVLCFVVVLFGLCLLLCFGFT